MADLTSLLYFALTYCLWGFASGLNDKEQEVEAGKDAVLKYQDSSIDKVEKLLWLRRNQCVFFYRENRLYENSQDPSFRDRVRLSEPHMKDGNVSIILFNTTINDTGTYKCHIVGSRTGRRRRAVSEVQHEVKLKVKPSSQPGGQTEDEGKKDEGKKDGGKEDRFSRAHFGLIAVVSVMVIAAMSAIGISKKLKKNSSLPPPPPDKETEQQLV